MTRYLALICILCLLGGCSGEPTPTPDAVATQIAVEEAAHATMTAQVPVATKTPQPSETPTAAATYTRRPTDTTTAVPTPTRTLTPSIAPTPSNTPRPAPTDTPAPTPTPIVIVGKGQTATDEIVPPASVSIAHLSHTGKRNFIVTTYQEGSSDLLVNVIGAYSGDRPIWGTEAVVFDVDADGAWTIELRPIGRTDSAMLRGTGDAVSGLFEPPEDGVWEIYHKGKRNFIVQLHCAGGSDLIQNEIGPVEGSTMVRFESGPCLWEVQADGEWGLKPRGAPAWPINTPKPTSPPKPTTKPQPPTATAAPLDFSKFPQIGQQVQAGPWSLAVQEVHKRKAVYFYDNAYVAQGHFLIVVVEVTNNGSGTSYFGKQDPYLTDKPGNVYTSSAKGSSYAQWMLGGLDSFYTDVNPGQTRKVAAAYDLPNNVRGALLSLKAGIWVYLGDFESMQAEE